MSHIYSFDNKIKRDTTKDNLYDLMQYTVAYNIEMPIYEHIVTAQEEMRLDLICYNLYGSYAFFEELMTLNNMKNPWSVKQGDVIYFAQEEDMNRLYIKEPANIDAYKSKVDKSKNTQTDANRAANQPSALSPNLQPITIDANAGVIRIIDKLT